MINTFDNVFKHVELYFRKSLPQYAVLEVRQKSSHPDDKHLFMVSAKKAVDGTYAVWTSWNEETQTLNHGHYGLADISECDRIFSEFHDDTQYFAVYRYSQDTRSRLFVTASEEDARKFCEQHGWKLTDENSFIWDLDYDAV